MTLFSLEKLGKRRKKPNFFSWVNTHSTRTNWHTGACRWVIFIKLHQQFTTAFSIEIPISMYVFYYYFDLCVWNIEKLYKKANNYFMLNIVRKSTGVLIAVNNVHFLVCSVSENFQHYLFKNLVSHFANGELLVSSGMEWNAYLTPFPQAQYESIAWTLNISRCVCLCLRMEWIEWDGKLQTWRRILFFQIKSCLYKTFVSVQKPQSAT